MSMSCFADRPSAFIQTHWHRLLPTWTQPVASVLIVLQSAESSLLQPSQQVHFEKQQLRHRFLEVAHAIAQHLKQAGHLVEVFDPRNGLPMLSPAGTLHLDDVAIVRDCLGFPTVACGGCATVLHPDWGSAVYPATLLCSASPTTLQNLLERFDWQSTTAKTAANLESWRSIQQPLATLFA